MRVKVGGLALGLRLFHRVHNVGERRFGLWLGYNPNLSLSLTVSMAPPHLTLMREGNGEESDPFKSEWATAKVEPP